MALGIILAGAKIGMQLYGGYKAQEEAREQAALQREATREQLRRMDVQFGQRQGTATARLGASGITMESKTSQKALSAMVSEYQQERAYQLKMGEKQAELTIQSGKQAMIQSVGSAAMTGLSAYAAYESPVDKPTVTPDLTKPRGWGAYGMPDVAKQGGIGVSPNPYSGNWWGR